MHWTKKIAGGAMALFLGAGALAVRGQEQQ